tara:strand:- start:362 stop:1126 length:765 start_codon:yes stop_codon:yes gene_type:complete
MNSDSKGSLLETQTPRLKYSLEDARGQLEGLQPKERIQWAIRNFETKFAMTTSFGIQSSVLLHMLSSIDGFQRIPVIWIDTGYLPKETYIYAEELINKLEINIQVVQSYISPARMEAVYGKLWETNNIQDLEKYHSIRKVKPLEEAFAKMNIECWCSGVRGEQTKNRKSMNLIDIIRNRFSLRPLLNWSKKDIYYYMTNNKLPQHPLFDKGYSTVGDWHSSAPDNINSKGRQTRFNGLKQECGIHIQGVQGEGI